MSSSSRIVSPCTVIVVRLLLSILLAAVAPLAVASDEQAGHEPDQASHGRHYTKGMHEVVIFVGATDDRGEWVETFGAEYLYSFMDNYAVGAFLDRAGGELRSSVLGVAFWARVVKGFGVMFGPGIEYLDEAHTEDGGHDTQGEEASKRQFLARFGVGYSFHVGKRYSLMPVVHADFVDGKVVWVTGLNFGIRFGKNSQ